MSQDYYIFHALASAPFYAAYRRSDFQMLGGLPAINATGRSVAVSPDGRYLAVGYDATPFMRVVDLFTMQFVEGTPTLDSSCRAVAFSHDGQWLATGTLNNLRVWRTGDWGVAADLGAPGEVLSIQFNVDSTRMLVALATNGARMYTAGGAWGFAAFETGSATRGAVFTRSGSADFAGVMIGSGTLRSYSFNPGPTQVGSTSLGSLATMAGRTASAGYALAIGSSFYRYSANVAYQSGFSTGVTFPQATTTAATITPDGQWCVLPTSARPVLVSAESGTTVINGPSLGLVHGSASAYIDPPNHQGYVYYSDGLPAQGVMVSLIDRQTQRIVHATTTDATGYYRLAHVALPLAQRMYQVLIQDPQPGSERDPVLTRIELLPGNSPTLYTVLPWLGADRGGSGLIQGNAKKASGEKADRVMIRRHASGDHFQTIIPDSAGDWKAFLPPGQYDISYFAEGCAPIIHGPYIIS